MPSDHMDTAQPSELACLPQEPQSHNEAQDLLLLQDYVCKLSHTQRTLDDTYALLQQTELLAGESTSKIAEPYARLAVA